MPDVRDVHVTAETIREWAAHLDESSEYFSMDNDPDRDFRRLMYERPDKQVGAFLHDHYSAMDMLMELALALDTDVMMLERRIARWWMEFGTHD